MKLLLDTHIFLWYISGDQRLPQNICTQIRDANNEVYFSVVSLWEVMIKYDLGKLPLPEPPEQYLPTQRQRHQIANLDLGEESVKRLRDLPTLHRDPFDRMLICQALAQHLTIITADEKMCAYPVPIINAK